MAQKRRAENRDLPPNVHPDPKPSGVIYFRYVVPAHVEVSKENRTISLGSDRQRAIKAGLDLNLRYGAAADLVTQAIARIEGVDRNVGRFLTRFVDRILPGLRVNGEPYSARTMGEYKRVCRAFDADWGHLSFAVDPARPVAGELTQAIVHNYLKKQSSVEVFIKHRSMAGVVFKHAISEGLTRENLPLAIVPPDPEPTKRHRLDLDGYKAIYAQAAPEIRIAMELALNCLQRRADIQTMRFDDVRDDHLHIVISKTRKHGKESFVRIPVSLPLVHSETGCKDLRALIARARESDVWSHYLVHHEPARKSKSKEKGHHTQLSPKQISDRFTAAAKACGLYVGLAPGERPTFHECIALGEYLYEDAGYSLEWIQTLRGHRNPKTTKLYLEGHEWTTVQI